MLLEHRTYREICDALDCSAATITRDVKAPARRGRRSSASRGGGMVPKIRCPLSQG
jgi:hypothetical protein